MFVVIVKEVGDLKKRPPEHKKSDAHFPLECKEFETREEAVKAYPGRPVLTHAEYSEFKDKMNEKHGVISVPPPWWSFLLFWRKE